MDTLREADIINKKLDSASLESEKHVKRVSLILREGVDHLKSIFTDGLCQFNDGQVLQVT